MRPFAVLAVLLTALGCSPSVGPEPVPRGPEDCRLADAKLQMLDCRWPDGAPLWKTPAGESFTVFCETAMDDGRDVNPQCVMRMLDCTEFEQRAAGKLCD